MTLRIVHKALYMEVADRLRDQIFGGSLAPGAWIDEQAVAEALGISRTPLREALKVLATEGIVRLEPRRGCFVSQLAESDLDEIFPVIALLEGRCAYEAAQRATPADLARLDELHARLERHAQARRFDAYYETNYEIHESIIALADNRWLAQTIADLRRVLRLSRLQGVKAPGRLEQSLSEHLSILAALKARDPDGAEALMKTHVLRQREALRRLAAAQDAPDAGPSTPAAARESPR